MENQRVLISGASIAGLSLAHWLHRYGFEVTVVERAREVRAGGQAVDFKGATHRAVLERMGILERVAAAEVRSGNAAIVSASGRRLGTSPSALWEGEINVPRGDLARIIHTLTETSVEHLFDDSISALENGEDAVTVTLESGATREFDLVVGADGIHSNVRRLAFGPEEEFVEHLGYQYALVGLPVDGTEALYNEPGRMAALGGSKAPAFFVFASAPTPALRGDVDGQKRHLVESFRGARWRVPELMDAVPGADDFFLDDISRANVRHYSRGRVVLLGDAAYGNALGGFGTGLALVGAYVLSGELARAGGRHETAFARYQEGYERYAAVSQQINAGRLLAPRHRAVYTLRNVAFTVLALAAPLVRLLDRPASRIDLDDYADVRARAEDATGGAA